VQNQWIAEEPLHCCRLLEVNGSMGEKIVFLFGWGPEEVGRASSLLYLVETASSINVEVRVFLYSEGVVLARMGIAEKIDSEIGERFKRLLENEKVKFYVCSEAAHKRGRGEKDLASSISMIGYAALLDMTMEAKTVITV
jgi:predicted peroxiredoxin